MQRISLVIFLFVGISEVEGLTYEQHCKENSTNLLDFTKCLSERLPTSIKEEENLKNLLASQSQLLSLFCMTNVIAENMETDLAIITDEGTEKKIPGLSSLTHDKYIYKSNERSRLFQKLLSWKANFYRVYMVFCSYKCSSDVLHLASLADLFDKQRYWILMEKQMSNMEIKMPTNAMSFIYNMNTDETSSLNKTRVSDCSASIGYDNTFILFDREKSSTLTLPHTYIYDQSMGWITTSDASLFQIYVSNFMGKHKPTIETIKAVTIQEPPFTMISPEHFHDGQQTCEFGHSCYSIVSSENNTIRNHSCCYGYMIDLIHLLTNDLDIKFELYLVEDGAYGREENGLWNGMVGDIVKGEADAIIAPLTIFKARTAVIDFTEPYITGGFSLLTTTAHKETFLNASIFEHLSLELWAHIFCLLILCCLLLCILECISASAFVLDLSESTLYLVGIMFGHDMGGKNPISFGARTVTISFAVCMLSIMSTYTATMTANKIAFSIELPITGFTDDKILNPTHEFKFGTFANSTVTDVFGGSVIKEWNRMNEFMKQYNFKDTITAVNDLKEGRLHALITDQIIVEYHAAQDRDCRLKVVGRPIGDAGLALATSKRLKKLNNELTYFLRQYKYTEVLNNLKLRWFEKECIINEDNSFSMFNFGGLFLAILSGVVIALISLCVENIIFILRKRKNCTLDYMETDL